jgi:N-acetylmuramoyl-L-alanine amidase
MEYELNLEVALRLQYMLEQIGFKVLMIRTTNDVNISNSQRAIIANNANANLCIHIHANDSTISDENGTQVLYPPSGTPCITLDISQKSKTLAQYLLNEMVKSTGANSHGLVANGDITVFQWSKIPTALVEMGFMNNYQEDIKLSNAEYQNKLALGMIIGIEDYIINVD